MTAAYLEKKISGVVRHSVSLRIQGNSPCAQLSASDLMSLRGSQATCISARALYAATGQSAWLPRGVYC